MCVVSVELQVRSILCQGIHTHGDKVFPLLLGNEGMVAVRTAELYRREVAFRRGKLCGTDLTQELTLRTIVFVKEGSRVS